MAASVRLLRIAVFLLLFNRCLTWDNDELELFDLVEEVNANFYELLGVGQEASSQEIRKAYRRLTLQLHPDKNKAEDAEEKFRQLVAVYEVLKDEEKRQMYNRVLVDGLPDWRMPVFYYRRARKMGFMELFGLLALIITIGQYLVGWAMYIEQRLTLEDMIDTRKKKEKRKKNKASEEAEELQEMMASIPKPSLLGLWPFRLPGFLYWCVRSVPSAVARVREERAERQRQKLLEEEEDEEEDTEVEKVVRKPKRRKMEVPEWSAEDFAAAGGGDKTGQQSGYEQGQAADQIKGGEWSEEELVFLAKAVNKFPGGTPKRWEKIATMVNRSVDDVCSKCKNMKGTYTMNLSTAVQGSGLASPQSKMAKKNQSISDSIMTTADSDSAASTPPTEKSASDSGESAARRRHRPTKIPKATDKTLLVSQTMPPPPGKSEDNSSSRRKEVTPRNNEKKGGGEVGTDQRECEVKEGGDSWTQNQQAVFEWALRNVPKGTDKRWDKIAEQITGKSKEDCILRFKYLAELVKKRKGENPT